MWDCNSPPIASHNRPDDDQTNQAISGPSLYLAPYASHLVRMPSDKYTTRREDKRVRHLRPPQRAMHARKAAAPSPAEKLTKQNGRRQQTTRDYIQYRSGAAKRKRDEGHKRGNNISRERNKPTNPTRRSITLILVRGWVSPGQAPPDHTTC